MRLVLLTMVLMTAAWPAAAQSVLDGPLAALDAAPAKTAKPIASAHARGKAKRVHHAAAKPTRAAPAEAGAPAVPTAAPAGSTAPDDPVSLGMKWQGDNSSAAQTRYQNLDGNAFGSGAEVGMKLHF